MRTLEQVRDQLSAARRDGVEFSEAWAAALSAVDAADWRQALEATRDAWQSGYEHRPAARPLRALHALVDDPDREPLPGLDGRCGWCGEPIPPGKRRTARYCSHACQRAAHGRRAAEPVAA